MWLLNGVARIVVLLCWCVCVCALRVVCVVWPVVLLSVSVVAYSCV